MRRRMLASLGGAKVPTARDYVQDGLIFQLDGLENGGFGVHTDGSGVPVDLSGGKTGLQSCDFKKDAITSYSGILRFTSSGDNIAQAYKDGSLTISHFGTQFFDTNKWRGLFVFKDHSSTNGMVQNMGYRATTQVTVSGSVKANLYDNKKTHLVVVLGDSLCRIYVDGVKLSDDPYTQMQGSLVDYGLGVSQNGGSMIDTHSMLIYDRALTDAEIAKNYAIDKARFGLQ